MLSHEIWFQITQQVVIKTRLIFENEVAFGEGQIMTLSFDTVCLLDHLVQCIYHFEINGCSSFRQINILHFFLYNA